MFRSLPRLGRFASALTVGAGLAVLASVPGLAATSSSTITLVSRASGSNGAVSTNGSYAPSLSAGGNIVAFESFDSLAGDPPHLSMSQVYVRDRQENTTTLVSVGVGGAPADNYSDAPAVGGKGNIIAFQSSATNLVAGFTPSPPSTCDQNGNIFVRNLKTGTTTLVSHVPGSPTTAGDAPSDDPVISQDGRYIAFESHATNLVSGETVPASCGANDFAQLLRYDTKTGAMVVISRHSGAHGAIGNGGSTSPSLSADGSLAAFASDSTNLVDGVTTVSEIYLRDFVHNTTTLVSRQTGKNGAPADNGGGSASLSADGSAVAFSSESTNLGDPTGTGQIYVRNLSEHTTKLVSVDDTGAPGTANSEAPSIDEDGDSVAFESFAPNLGDSTGTGQIYLRDLDAKTTKLMSHTPSGAPGNGESEDVALSAHGIVLAFESSAGNLTTDSTGGASEEVYVSANK